ncbi:hypothetical protein ABZ419_04160 [Streptomyces cinnamoneus]|uniref:hypothetical protein n=1 Tax=Streptomyces cinnamoneus TaxID=53446 RepID=UPI0033CC55C5
MVFRSRSGPVTGTYGVDKEQVIGILNDVIATEVVCWLRYTRHAISATGTTRRLLESILEEEEEHADDLLDLIGS